MMKVSVIVPSYNEDAYIAQVLDNLFLVNFESKGYVLEIVVVDNGSTDKTAQILERYHSKHLKIVRVKKNLGKGYGVRQGIIVSTGDLIAIQDADLEYKPEDLLKMLEVYIHKSEIVVYGNRKSGIKNSNFLAPYLREHQSILAYHANTIISIFVFLLYGKYISDTLTAYKIFPAKIIKEFKLDANGFELDHEITSLLLKRNIQIVEVPISYFPRTKKQGKKIRCSDFFMAIRTYLVNRFADS